MAERPIRWSGRGVGRPDRFQPLEREREMRAALGRDERVDLVDDHRVDGAKHLAGIRRQQQVERLGRRDQDVGRVALEPRALDRRRVAGPDGDRRRVVHVAARGGAVGDAGKRRPQVPLDVDRQRLERRDVQHAAAPIRARAASSNISRLMHHRNAVSVLPLPVGARIRVDCPCAIAGQPCA